MLIQTNTIKFQANQNLMHKIIHDAPARKLKGRFCNKVKQMCNAFNNSNISTRWSTLSNLYKIFARQVVQAKSML